MFEKAMPILEMKHIVKQYGGRVLFQDFSLSIQKNEMLGISGASGSGKSTLLNMIGMFEKPDSGDIRLFGKPLPTAESKEGRNLMHSKLFYLFQNFALVENQSVDYNLEIPMMGKKITKSEKKNRKMMSLEKVGLNVSLSEKVFHLSGGEQQRVAIARGYLKDFELLLADEPTGSLDAANRDEVIEILKQFHRDGKTIVIVSHDPVVMQNCQRIIRI